MSISSKSSAVVPSCEIDSGLRAPSVNNRTADNGRRAHPRLQRTA
jgi:hypothetical protein